VGAAGSAGAAGTAGSAGTGGTAGSGGTLGAGGAAGQDGSVGSGGTAGTGGTAGASGGAGTAGTAGATGAAGSSGAGGAAGTAGSGGSGGGSTFPPVSDFSKAGPFATTSGPGGTTCTITRPNPLGAQGRIHPVIIWGNGTGASPATYQQVHTHWASHGFIVAAANTSSAGNGTAMLACLDYVIAQNGMASSAFFNRVDAAHVGASGHSQGGAGTLMAGRDARVDVTAPLQPYVAFPLGGFQSSSIAQQNGAMFLLSGSADTIATPTANQQPIFNQTNVPVFWGTLIGATHTGTAIGNLGGYRGPMTAWFRLHLMGDENARSLFYGANCGLCTSTAWTEQRRGIQ
jgi:hypothetical protein